MKRAEIAYNPPASNQGDSHTGKFPSRHPALRRIACGIESWVPAFVRLSGPFSITRAGIAYLTTVTTGDIQNSENDIQVLNK